MNPPNENKPENTAPVPAPPPKKHWGCLITFIVILLAVVVIPAVLFLGAPHRWEVDPVPTDAELISMRQVVSKLSSSLFDDDGKMVESVTLELEPDEVNAILNNMQRMTVKQFRKKLPGVFYLTQWENGALVIRISYTFGVVAVNSHFELTPSVDDHKLKFAARNCSVGWLPLKSSAVDEGLRKAVRELEKKHDEYRAAIKAVDSLEVRGSKIRMTLEPKKLQALLPLLLRTIRSS